MENYKIGKINHEKQVNADALTDHKSINKVVSEQGQRLAKFKAQYTKQRDALARLLRADPGEHHHRLAVEQLRGLQRKLKVR